MIDRTGMNSNEIDSKKLRNLLDSISAQLTIPFLERRGKNKAHKDSPLEELQEAVNELTEKEKELSAAVGIAKMLLDSNDLLKKKQTKHLDAIKNLQEENSVYKRELENIQNMLKIGENKYEKLTETLAIAESQLLRKNVESQIRPATTKNNGFSQETSETLNADEIKEIYQKELERYKSKV